MILVTGWTGNTGSIVVEQIRKKYPGKKIVGITRCPNAARAAEVIAEAADLGDERGVEAVFEKYTFDLVLHIANIRYSPVLVRLANAYQVPHIVLVHTTGIYSKYRAYSGLYRQIEDAILRGQNQRTSFTILRPTMIYGNRRDYNMHKLIRVLARFPVFPVFGDGSAVMQPVHVEDVATAIVACMYNDRVKNKAYDLSGGSVVTYMEVLRLITGFLNKRILFVHLPINQVIRLVALHSRLVKKPWITIEQVERLQEDKSYPHEAAKADLGFRPRSFRDGICQEIREMRDAGVI
jgi:nucleoside-diphosphate-sugar epimerase